MKSALVLIFSIILLNLNGQDFGRLHMPQISDDENDKVFSSVYSDDYVFSFIHDFDWSAYAPKICEDGWYTDYFPAETVYLSTYTLTGCVENGNRQGFWAIEKSVPKIIFSGYYADNLKQGLWKQIYYSPKGDSVCTAEVYYIDDLAEGVVKEYYSNGFLFRESHFQKGVRHGLETIYSWSDSAKQGSIQSETEFVHGVPVEKEADKPKPAFISQYTTDDCVVKAFVNKKGELNGMLTKTYRNGVVAFELECRNNKPYTVLSAKDISGRTLDPGSLKDGSGSLIQYDSTGIVCSVFSFRNQLISGKIVHFYENGIDTMEHGFIFTDSLNTYKTTTVSLKEPDLNIAFAWTMNFAAGTDYHVYSINGLTQYHIFCGIDDSVRFTRLNENGLVNEIFIRCKDIKCGVDMFFHDNGKLKSIGNYAIIEKDCKPLSVRNGLFRYYYPNGILQAEIMFLNGQYSGKSYYYDDAGNLRLIYVPDDAGSSYYVFDEDTVNVIDACGLKQGKWLDFSSEWYDLDYVQPNSDEEYYQNGKPCGLWTSGKFYFGEKTFWINADSAWCWNYSRNGILYAEGLLVLGERSGEWLFYDDHKGFLKAKGMFCNDMKSGLWELYNRRGKILKIVLYEYNKEINSFENNRRGLFRKPSVRLKSRR